MATPTNKPTAAELLKQVSEDTVYRSIRLERVEEILADETFTGDMLVTTENGVSEPAQTCQYVGVARPVPLSWCEVVDSCVGLSVQCSRLIPRRCV